jgi:Ni,Fe-hydrogenase III small subunit
MTFISALICSLRGRTKNMRKALERTRAATPDPKWVVAVGDCALDGGIFAEVTAGRYCRV